MEGSRVDKTPSGDVFLRSDPMFLTMFWESTDQFQLGEHGQKPMRFIALHGCTTLYREPETKLWVTYALYKND